MKQEQEWDEFFETINYKKKIELSDKDFLDMNGNEQIIEIVKLIKLDAERTSTPGTVNDFEEQEYSENIDTDAY